MNNKHNKLVIFDCDGTLVDGQHLIADAMDICFEKNGLVAPKRSDVQRIIGLSLTEAMAVLLPDEEPDTHEDMATQYKISFAQMRARTGNPIEPLYKGTVEALRALDDAGYVLAVATGKSLRGLTRVLSEHSLLDMFVSLQTADHHPSKPHPSMIHTAISDAGSHADHVIMVGDTTFDMQMAAHAGCKGLGVSWGYHTPEELNRAGADVVLDDFRDVPDYIFKSL